LVEAALMQSALPSAFGESHLVLNPADTAVIAAVGQYTITVKEFREGYEFGPSFIQHSADPKADYLQYLINEKLIALDGFAHGLDTMDSVRRILRELEDDIAVTEWYRREIVPLVHIDSLRVQEGVEEKSVTLTYRSISSDDEISLRDIKSQLDRGMLFDSLFASLKEAPAFAVKEVSGDFFTIHESNAQIADTLARMKPGSCSEIIRTGSGFSLVRLDRTRKDLITTITAYESMRAKVERYFAEHILDSITVSYTRSLMEKCPPTISGESLNTIVGLLLNPAGQSPTEGQEEIGMKDLVRPEVVLPDNPGGRALVTSTCDAFTIRDFTVWYSYRHFKIAGSRRTATTVWTIKEMIFRMVRDKRLIRIARAKGYGEDPNVQSEMNQWKSKLSYWKQKSAAISPPVLTDEAVHSFYSENKRRYERDAKGAEVAYEQAKGKVANDLLLFEYNKQLFRYIQSLKEKYPVTVNESVLKSIHVADEGLSKKIDVVILKRGGTLPRRAFPSIDKEWQFFQ
jgi:hypothetical protein